MSDWLKLNEAKQPCIDGPCPYHCFGAMSTETYIRLQRCILRIAYHLMRQASESGNMDDLVKWRRLYKRQSVLIKKVKRGIDCESKKM